MTLTEKLINQLFNMAPSYILNFQDNVTLLEKVGRVPELHFGSGTFNLNAFSSGLLKVVQILCTRGATKSFLSDLVLEIDGFSVLPKLHYFLSIFSELGILGYTLDVDGRSQTKLIPLANGLPFYWSEADLGKQYQASRFAYCHMEKGQLVLESPLSFAKVSSTDWRIGALFTQLAQPQNYKELANSIPNLSEELVQGFLDFLLSTEIIHEHRTSKKSQQTYDEAIEQWDFHDLLFHTRSRLGRHSNPIGLTLPHFNNIDPLPAFKSQVYIENIDLFKPDLELIEANDLPFFSVLETRKSIRKHGENLLSVEQLGEFLYRSVRSKGSYLGDYMEYSHRPYPSAGSAYELETYIVVHSCKNISEGLYHYCPRDHKLGKVAAMNSKVKSLVTDASQANKDGNMPQILLVLAARFPRLTWRCQSIAYAAILKDVGCLYQTMYLVATAMGLAPCALACGDSDLFSEAAGTHYYAETSVGEFMLGSRPN